jgi:hypothetical protein
MKQILLAALALALIVPVTACKEEKKEPEKTEAAAEPATSPTSTEVPVTAEAVAETEAVAAATEEAAKESATDKVVEKDAVEKTDESEVVSEKPKDVIDRAEYAKFEGRWAGAEGTWIMIAPASTEFMITIKNLDSIKGYSGKPGKDQILMQRDGKDVVIKPGTGKDTGMKDLVDKKNCIVVGKNEGYCKD